MSTKALTSISHRFRLGENCESDEEYHFSDCDYSDDNQFSDAAISDDDHVSKFSKYSMTSSVIRRTQGYKFVLKF